jgi:hypothetical protein
MRLSEKIRDDRFRRRWLLYWLVSAAIACIPLAVWVAVNGKPDKSTWPESVAGPLVLAATMIGAFIAANRRAK